VVRCYFVTPCVGVWIETFKTVIDHPPQRRHALRGRVD